MKITEQQWQAFADAQLPILRQQILDRLHAEYPKETGLEAYVDRGLVATVGRGMTEGAIIAQTVEVLTELKITYELDLTSNHIAPALDDAWTEEDQPLRHFLALRDHLGQLVTEIADKHTLRMFFGTAPEPRPNRK
jgi:hypothetical protein